ncbi:hypothetical protein ACUN7V_12570 [Quadrisphaera oryzae]|uniref:hypothetical protein n=1 Tax=Quadrisphaera TaxID=317661 RepID=UPI0016487828|nr:hypothetical protein [Quadrisphaera sp. RL12-1S]MBC3762039.1 hypothetical protein [Quadrisphaera sp. RL12-1S]
MIACDECGQSVDGDAHETVTGRRLCNGCWTRFQGTAASLVSGGGATDAIATAGWLERLRRLRGR